MIKRENNYDFLRAVASIAVILLHISSTILATSFKYNLSTYGVQFTGNVLLSFVFDTLPRFAVPCFVMLSGAFNLADHHNVDFRYFYSKSFRSVGITTIIFSGLYTLYKMLKKVVKICKNQENLMVLFEPLKELAMGKPFFHMWYLYMLLGLYLVTPVVIMLADTLKKKDINIFGGVTWIFLCLSSLSYWTSSYTLGWDVGMQFRYLSYYMAGYSIRKWAYERKSNFRGLCLIATGIVVELFLAFMRCVLVKNGSVIQRSGDVVVRAGRFEIFAYEGLDPIVVIASVCIFAGFSLLKLRRNISRFASLTFLIYLIHGGVWDIVKKVIFRVPTLFIQNDLAIPVYVIVVFSVTLFLAFVYQSLWKALEQRLDITYLFCRLFRLDGPGASDNARLPDSS